MLGLRLLPQGEVGLVALLAYSCQLAALVFDILQRATRQDAILVLLVIRLDIKVDRAIRLISKAVVHNLLHQLLLFDDVTCGMRLYRGTQTAQRIHSLMVSVGVVLCNLHRLQLFQTSLLGYLVLTLVGIVFQMAHVGDITHVPYFISQMLQITEHQIEGDGRTCMSQMRITIDRRSADIHTHIGSV